MNDTVRDIQTLLKARGYSLGSSGPNRDGVDGDPGPLLFAAVLTELRKAGGADAGVTVTVGLTRSAVDLISVPVLRAACPERTDAELGPWVEPIKAACRKFEINTIRRIASFVAVFLSHESNLRVVGENLNYSVDGLLSKFGRHRISEADARRLGRKPGEGALSEDRQRQIANLIYGGAFGLKQLGNTQPNDGWDMRGTGAGQMTGRDNFTRFAAAMGMPLADAIAYARTIEGGVMSAAWFWEKNDLNRLADTPGVADETQKINGGQNGFADREQRFNAAVAAMIAAERSL